MRVVIQRVNKASVSVDGEIVGEIGKGLFILLGIGKLDSKEDANRLADKVCKMRLMADGEKKMNLSVGDLKASMLVVSQFTLYANTAKGNRPSFIEAASPDTAKEIYEYFVSCIKENGIEVATGRFGAYMKIETELDGPVTIIE